MKAIHPMIAPILGAGAIASWRAWHLSFVADDTFIGAEDNLLKGAAVQAVQNLNLALGLPELAGIL